jgi:oligopeptide/dipeptide ABC transporter ATP-binding protein
VEAAWVARGRQSASHRLGGTDGTGATGNTGDAVVAVEHLTVAFPAKVGCGEVVWDVSFEVRPGERLGLVGESGSGKSLTARAVMQLIPKPGEVTSGRVLLNGTDLGAEPKLNPSSWRGSTIAMITQDPLSSLNPLVRVGTQMTEMLRFHRGMSRSAATAKAKELLAAVGLPDPASTLTHYPAVLSGGMRQRVALAIAVSCEPRLLIADEPTTSLDVTIQAQVLDLLEQLTAEQGSAVLLISHDLGVVATFCDRLMVMYGGRIVESGPTAQIIARPAHPYTRALMASVPSMTTELPDRLASIPGSPPAGGVWSAGCTFAPRCPIARELCLTVDPELLVVPNDGDFAGQHAAACHASRDETWGQAA